jgi:hypothetical protein
MAELTAFTPTTKDEFAQLARDRKSDFDLLRNQGQWTTSVYVGGYIVEARLKYKICELLDVDNLPAIFKTHNLLALIIFAGLSKALKALPQIENNLQQVNDIHSDSSWRYICHNLAHKTESDDLNDWLFHPTDGVITWLGL